MIYSRVKKMLITHYLDQLDYRTGFEQILIKICRAFAPPKDLKTAGRYLMGVRGIKPPKCSPPNLQEYFATSVQQKLSTSV